MSLADQIQSDLKDAMKAGDAIKRDTLRMLVASLKNARIDKGSDLDEKEVLGAVRTNVKTRKDSAQQYRDAGRPELADKEEAEIGVLEGYLPQQLDEAATRGIVEEAIRETGAEGKAGIGLVMKAVMAKHRDVVDGKTVQRLAGELLG